jgi:hypothetical protein
MKVLRYRTERQSAVSYFDHENRLDVIDFWNLRAAGWEVLPMPRAVGASAQAVSVARTFIKNHEGKDEEHQNYQHRVTIIKSRSLKETEHEAFVNSLREQSSQRMRLPTMRRHRVALVHRHAHPATPTLPTVTTT